MAIKRKSTKKTGERVNQSQAIRDYKREHKRLKPKQIAEALTAQGIPVTPQYVSMVLSNAKRKKGKRKSAARANGIHEALQMPNNAFIIEELRMARLFVEKAGGVSQAQKVLAAYKQLIH